MKFNGIVPWIVDKTKEPDQVQQHSNLYQLSTLAWFFFGLNEASIFLQISILMSQVAKIL